MKIRLPNKIDKKLKKVTNLPNFPKHYLIFSLAALLLSTAFWAILGAKIQLSNADQLVAPYQFHTSATFHNATFAGQHSFLFKWPIFWLVSLFGLTNGAFIFFSVLVTLITVGALAFILYKINSRPLVVGTFWLALASVLLLVPAQPYAGGLLPVNMAMLTTRNLEYILYIASLAAMVKEARLRNWKFWTGAAMLTVLIASDKLFLSISLGGALLALICYALINGWGLVNFAVRWLVATATSIAAALGLLNLVNYFNISHISSQTGPYGLDHSVKDVVLGVFYSITGFLTNFGANPSYDQTVIKKMPHQFISRLFSFAGVAYLVNFMVLVGLLFAVYKILKLSLEQNKVRAPRLNTSLKLSVALIWTTIAAFVVFVLTKHDYAVDSRYLSIALFALFISAIVYSTGLKRRDHVWLLAGGFLCLSIAVGLPATYNSYSLERNALTPVDQRDVRIAQALSQHHVDVLVGDYWRVVPIKQNLPNQKIMSLIDCTTSYSLGSNSSQLDINHHSFAYLLSADRALSNYPQCNLNQIFAAYGRPNTSVVIAGNQLAPKEQLLFYDKGIHKSSPKVVFKTPSTVLPINLDEIPYTSCPLPTILNIVAHQDDDLLFMNPDLNSDISQGHCVRTIYITAGDAGSSYFYWLGRQQGSEAAYSYMLKSSDTIWIQRIVKLDDSHLITIANPKANPRISLIFMNLPDGNVKGQGFSSSHFQSLAELEAGKIKQIQTVDGQSTYTFNQLQSGLEALMSIYQPAEIRTQSIYPGKQFPDHSDHNAVGRLVQRAHISYESQQFEGRVSIPLVFYEGYPSHEQPPNVSGAELQAKILTFLNYAKFDGGVCRTMAECNKMSYGAYLPREYKLAN